MKTFYVIAALTGLALIGLVFTRFSQEDNPEDYENKYKDLIHLLLDGNSDLVTRKVNLLLENPGSFIINHEEIFGPYFITEPGEDIQELIMITLIYYMEKENSIVVLDWKQETEDIIYFVNGLLTRSQVEDIEVSEEEMLMDTESFLSLCGKLIDHKDYCLIELGRGNDAYEVFVLDKSKALKLMSFNKSLGLSMTVID